MYLAALLEYIDLKSKEWQNWVGTDGTGNYVDYTDFRTNCTYLQQKDLDMPGYLEYRTMGKRCCS